MCNIRGFCHSCNHTVFRYISTCRATFSDPNSPSTPRCLPSASYLIKLSDECVQCQFDTFCDTWQKRITAAEQRRDVFAAQLNPRQSQQDSWNRSSKFNDSLDSWDHWSSESDDSAPAEENYWGDSEESPEIDDSMNPIEKSILIKERDEADQEARRLQHEFDREKWELWQGFLGGSDVSTLKKKANYGTQRRRTKPKVNGGSSLRYVQNADDLPDPEVPPADVYLFGINDLSGDESDQSDCSIPALSRSSTISDGDSSSDEDELDGLSEDPLIQGEKELRLVLDPGHAKRSLYNKFEPATTLEDSEDDNEMLPMWLECF